MLPLPPLGSFHKKELDFFSDSTYYLFGCIFDSDLKPKQNAMDLKCTF
jgi:hypothetical protein